MRKEFQRWARDFPAAVAQGNEAFAAAEVARFVVEDIPSAVRALLPLSAAHLQVQGSAGRGQWTHTPWVALLDPAITATVQEGHYVVYLLSRDGERLFLSVNQGCTRLYSALGIDGAEKELRRRAQAMRERIGSRPMRFGDESVDLGADLWRARLYQAGDVANVAYATRDLPDDTILAQDLQDAVAMYGRLVRLGGWEPDDQITRDAEDEAGIEVLVEAKRYRLHRSIERQPAHTRAVKRVQGVRCRGCERQLEEIYGPIAAELVEVHHLFPLSALAEGETVTFDPKTDFAVLCPNCHAVIHRMDDVSDLEGLRKLFFK